MSTTVYVETTVISYLVSRPSRELVIAARQQVTAHWWWRARQQFRMVVSEVVLQEVALGDPESAARRLVVISDLEVVQLTDASRELARALMQDLWFPATAAADAQHIAAAAENGAQFLVTWNCKHIANARTRSTIERTLRYRGYHPPMLCTPEELFEART